MGCADWEPTAFQRKRHLDIHYTMSIRPSSGPHDEMDVHVPPLSIYGGDRRTLPIHVTPKLSIDISSRPRQLALMICHASSTWNLTSVQSRCPMAICGTHSPTLSVELPADKTTTSRKRSLTTIHVRRVETWDNLTNPHEELRRSRTVLPRGAPRRRNFETPQSIVEDHALTFHVQPKLNLTGSNGSPRSLRACVSRGVPRRRNFETPQSIAQDHARTFHVETRANLTDPNEDLRRSNTCLRRGAPRRRNIETPKSIVEDHAPTFHVELKLNLTCSNGSPRWSPPPAFHVEPRTPQTTTQSRQALTKTHVRSTSNFNSIQRIPMAIRVVHPTSFHVETRTPQTTTQSRQPLTKTHVRSTWNFNSIQRTPTAVRIVHSTAFHVEPRADETSTQNKQSLTKSQLRSTSNFNSLRTQSLAPL